MIKVSLETYFVVFLVLPKYIPHVCWDTCTTTVRKNPAIPNPVVAYLPQMNPAKRESPQN